MQWTCPIKNKKDPFLTSNATAFEEANRFLVGGVNSPARAFKAVGGTPIFIKSAEGGYLTSIENKRYLDLVGSWGPMILGHSHPYVIEKLQKSLKNGTSYGAPTLIETEMAKLVTDCVSSIEKVRMVSSGTEAALSALRLARGAKKRSRIIKFQGCYHGHSDSFLVEAGSSAATLKIETSPGVPGGLSSLTLIAKYNDIESVKKLLQAHGEDVAAIFVEPVAGNMGLVPPKKDFLQLLRSLADEYGALLVFDEVMTGFRLSLGGAQSLLGVEPDLTCLGKIIGGGLPVGAFGGKKKWMNQIAPDGEIFQAGTLSGNPLAMTSGHATISYLKDNPKIYESLEKKGKFLEDVLNVAIEKTKTKARVQRLGSMLTLFFSEHPVHNYEDAKKCDSKMFARFFHGMLERGVYFPPSQFEAAFISDKISITELLKVGDDAIKVLSKIQEDR